MNEIRNYVGVTGCVSDNEARLVLNALEGCAFRDHVPMLGVLISPRNLNQEWHSPRYPKLCLFDSIIETAHDRCFLTIHIDEKASSAWLSDLFKLMGLINYSDKIHGIQVNVKHPKLDDIRELKERTGKKIILQYSDDFIDNEINIAMNEIEKYIPFVDYLLIDPSRGCGIQIDTEVAINHYIALKSRFKICVGFAGGFNKDNISARVISFKNGTKGNDFSLDVESGIRTNEKLDFIKFNDYLANLSKVL